MLINEPSKQAGLLGAAADAAAATGQLAHANEIVMSITDPDEQAKSLAKLALSMHEAGQQAEARRMLAASWAGSHWTTPLSASAIVAPSILCALANDFGISA